MERAEILTEIVDKKGLAQILMVSEDTIYRTWHQYPHFFVGMEQSAKMARFDVNDVIQYLKDRDYADIQQSQKLLGCQGKDKRISREKQTRICDTRRSLAVGAGDKAERPWPTSSKSGILSFPNSR